MKKTITGHEAIEAAERDAINAAIGAAAAKLVCSGCLSRPRLPDEDYCAACVARLRIESARSSRRTAASACYGRDGYDPSSPVAVAARRVADTYADVGPTGE